LLLWSMPSAAEDKRLAVLEVQGSLPGPVLLALSDEVRSGALAALSGQDDYLVMTRESTNALLSDMGLDPETCTAAASCEVDVGRQIGADLIITGSFFELEGSQNLTLKVFETDRGKLLATHRVEAEGQKALLDATRAGGLTLLDEAGLASPQPRGNPYGDERNISSGNWNFELPASRARSVVQFKSTPTGAAVVMDGTFVCETPCSREVEHGPHRFSFQMARYLNDEQRAGIDGDFVLSATLEPTFGWLAVETSPVAVPIRLNDDPPRPTPITRHEVAPGPFTVEVADDCFAGDGRRVVVERGEDERVVLKVHAIEAGLDVSVTDEKENALSGTLWVDGREVGRVPGMHAVSACAEEAEIRTSSGTWTGSLALRPLKVNELTAVVQRRPITSAPPEALPAGAPLPAGALSGFTAKIIYTQARLKDATRAAALLKSQGLTVIMDQTSVGGNTSHRDKVYYYTSSSLDEARAVCQVLSPVETFGPTVGGKKYWNKPTMENRLNVWIVD